MMSTLVIYQIRIAEELSDQWSEWFSPLVIQHEHRDGTTLSGPIRDQAELLGLLGKVHNLNLTLVAVNRMEVR